MFDKINHAAKVLDGVAHKTQLVRAFDLSNCNLYLKTENLQRTGSFKVRGAYYKISTLTPEEKERGVIACSAGNHAQGVALAAQKEGISAVICIPEGAPLSKIAATRSYGAEVVLCKGVYDDAYRRAVEIQEESGRTFVHPFNDEAVIAGQGTVGLELMAQLPDVDAVFVPVGGGGLISGVAMAVKTINPNCKVYGVQAEGAPSMFRAYREHQICELDQVVTIADGIAVKKAGDLTYELCCKYVDDILTVSDDEISSAILAMMERYKMVAEGAGAVSVAAVMYNKVDVEGKNVVAVVSGGNIDVNILSRVITKGLLKSGRMVEFATELPDKPGQLIKMLEIISKTGANVVSINHSRSNAELEVGRCIVDVVLETNDNDHIYRIYEALTGCGYKIV